MPNELREKLSILEMKSRYSIVVTTKPCKISIFSFVAHYLSLGASEIFLFIDAKEDVGLELHKLPSEKVVIFYCDDAYWMKKHSIKRPDDHRRRQVINANLALKLCSTDFIGHFDIDEFVVSVNDLGNDLYHLPAQFDGLRIHTAESIYNNVPESYDQGFCNLFKKQVFEPATQINVLKQLHQKYAGILRKGLQGHINGKVIIRKRTDFHIGIHNATKNEASINLYKPPGITLLHYVYQGPKDWVDKYLRRLSPLRFVNEKPLRQEQWRSVLNAALQGDNELWELYLNLNIFNDKRLELLGTSGLLYQHDLELPAKAEILLNFPRHEFSKRLPEFDIDETLNSFKSVSERLSLSPLSKPTIENSHAMTTSTKRCLVMQPASIKTFEERLRAAKVYLEYGSGASTVRACELGVPEVHTVETSREFLDGVLKDCAAIECKSKIHAHFVDIGPTKAWGYPVSRAESGRWPAYSSSAWDALNAKNKNPDLILVDGRFRVSAFLYSLMMCQPGTTILFDDYRNRSHYHCVEKIIKPINFHGRMAEFRKSELNIKDVLPLLIRVAIDPR